MARDELQVNFRMPAELKARLETAAKGANRTLTAEIVFRLEGSFQTSGEAASVSELEARVFSRAEGIFLDALKEAVRKLTRRA